MGTKMEELNNQALEQQFEIDLLKRKNHELDQVSSAKQ